MKTAIDIYVIDAIRKKRIEQHVSQAMLASFINVSKGFIGMAESPKYDIKYNIRHINEIARFLGCSPRDFLPEQPL
ncbi:helix-turn-helix transcriptional regulator [uncultured Alistipes sp.]|uniref:helix-turn-helix domain-containing protein n=1 Tax=uncultured Alistipes sp. TaxID=538949 RepID=UPI0025CE8497|nr:helix-turn-helix transcriptional regulator [uncultured Alistipes sp.]